MGALDRLAELGLQLPPAPQPVASYVTAVRTGDLVFTSGQLPLVDGALPATGLVGEREGDVSPATAQDLARTAALNGLAVVDAALRGSGGLDAVVRVVKVTGFVASAPGFTGQPGVVNGASDLLVEVLGEAGRHARSAVGVAELPLGSPVEVELVVEVA
ncbi:RidA family protein [Quadrisphaera sp. INWT6]|uniref:RidA family protein n=1 Tax=Quadrisphaera sp. INWT6 TaxID=2596917 RepID=UPI001891F59F|nr:RidA family protein [Quadrisphaera sp. INWT6]MBF5081889.1 RidA family protein [Quadrisphaera sp. INWT6]